MLIMQTYNIEFICCCQTARVCILVVHIFPYHSFKHCTKWIEDFRNMDIFLKKSDFSTKTSEGFMILQLIKNSHNKSHDITFLFYIMVCLTNFCCPSKDSVKK